MTSEESHWTQNPLDLPKGARVEAAAALLRGRLWDTIRLRDRVAEEKQTAIDSVPIIHRGISVHMLGFSGRLVPHDIPIVAEEAVDETTPLEEALWVAELRLIAKKDEIRTTHDLSERGIKKAIGIALQPGDYVATIYDGE